MFREEDPCVGVFVSNYYRDTGAGWRDHADYDAYLHENTHKLSYKKNVEPSTRSGERAISFITDFSLTHKYRYVCDLCVHVGLRQEAPPLPIRDTLH